MAEIELMTLGDVTGLAALLAAQPPGYLDHFQPFGFTVKELVQQLAKVRQDRYWALREEGALAGFCMLRGWDEGYERPAFGVFVAQTFAGRGLARQAMDFAIAWCRTRGCPALMLSVSPKNPRAQQIYWQAGFRPTGLNAKTGHTIMELKLR